MNTVSNLLHLCLCVIDNTSSECCHLSVSPSVTTAGIVRLVLDAKNIHSEEHLYTLIAIPSGVH